MARRLLVASLAFVSSLSAGTAVADTAADLIALDQQWGAAGVKGDTASAGKLLADSLISVSETGVTDKQGELAGTTPLPAGTAYEPLDYRVTMLDTDTAIMTHSTKGKDPHHSMHVWSRKSGEWKVVATSSTPVKAK